MPKIILLSEALKLSLEQREAIVNDPDYEVHDDRQGIPLEALSPEEFELIKKRLIGDPLTEAEEEQLGTTHDRYQKPN